MKTETNVLSPGSAQPPVAPDAEASVREVRAGRLHLKVRARGAASASCGSGFPPN